MQALLSNLEFECKENEVDVVDFVRFDMNKS